MAKKKTSQQPAPVKDKPQAPAQGQARTAAQARVTTVSLTTCLVSVVVALALGLCIGSMLLCHVANQIFQLSRCFDHSKIPIYSRTIFAT